MSKKDKVIKRLHKRVTAVEMERDELRTDCIKLSQENVKLTIDLTKEEVRSRLLDAVVDSMVSEMEKVAGSAAIISEANRVLEKTVAAQGETLSLLIEVDEQC